MPSPPSADLPRYLQLAAQLRGEINAGKYSGDTIFPTESELCRKHGMSRFTVREALRRLQNEGLIARRRGSGTKVQPASARGGALHQPLSNVAEILQYARDTRVSYAATGLCRIPRAVGEQIVEDTGGKWHCFVGQRNQADSDRPIAVIDAYVHARLADAVAQIDPSRETLFGQLEELGGISVARLTQDIQAVAASGTVAAALGVPRRTAVLRILRCYYEADGRLFEISVSHHPGDRFAYSMHIDVDS